MKRILILLIGLIGIAYGQSAPTSAKTRFVNGLYVGTKLDDYFAAADSNAIYWRADSALMAKYKGAARRVLFVSDSSTYLNQVVRTFGDQTIGGVKTFSSDAYFNGLRIGRGNGNLVGNTGVGLDVFRDNTTGAENTAFGSGVLIINTTGSQNAGFGYRALYNNMTGGSNTAIGYRALTVASNSNNTAVGNQSLASTTSGSSNTSVGSDAMIINTTGSQNTALGQTALNQNTTASTNTGVGYQALLGTTTGGGNTALGHNSGTTNSTGTNNTYIGLSANASANNRTNETVIGASAIGNGSNTVTIGNSSVTDNYFSGVLRATRGIFSSTPTLINTTTHNGIDTLQVNGSIFGTKGRFNNGYTSQIEAWGWNNIQGASTNAGEIRFGGTSSIQGRLIYASAGNTTMYVENTFDDAAAEIILRTRTAGTAVELLKLQNNGLTSTIVYNTTVGATNRDVFVDNTGLIGYVSSFRASKKNIAPISNTDWLHSLNPVTFNYRVKDKKGNYTDSAYNELEYGLVAEEVEKVNKEMVFYDVDSSGKKQLRGVHYSKLIIPLLAEMKEHKKKIDEQQAIIEALLTRIQKLEAKFN